MDTRAINILNAGLIVFSLLLACIIPFELFLFSYAVLGPLHYLTEINWLNDRNYFVKSKRYVIILVAFAALLSLPFLLHLPLLHSLKQTALGSRILYYSQKMSGYMVFISLIFSIGLIYFKKWQHVGLYFVFASLLSFIVIKYLPVYALFLAMFIPTLIHVYLFTLLFMIYGTLNDKGQSGWLAIILLLLCPFVVMLLPVDAANYVVSEPVQSTYTANNFNRVKYGIAGFLHLKERNASFDLGSVAGIKIQVFLAFAYTYHYLNWFSKTSIIGWGKNLQRNKVLIILGFWILSMGLYYYNFRTGLLALFFLSLLHVFLEFPLNIHSVKGIFYSLVKGKARL